MSDQEPCVRFTGWESDEFVSFTRWLLAIGSAVDVEVIGREPILATPVRIHGRPIAGHWEGYRRVIDIITEDGTSYEIGGSNSTRPIASTLIHFRGPFGDFEALRDQELGDCIRNQRHDPMPLLIARRMGHVNDAAVAELIERLDHGTLSLGDDELAIALHLGGTLSDIAVLPLLTRALSHQNEVIRRLAALRFRAFEPIFKTYGEHAPECARAINGLAECVGDDPDWQTRTYAAEDLGYFYNGQAVSALEHALFDDEHSDVRWAAAIALGRTNASNVGPILLAAGEREAATQVRRACLLGLARLVPAMADENVASNFNEVADFALANLHPGVDSSTADFAAALLGELAYPGAANLVARDTILDRILPVLLSGVESADYATKATSAYALGRYVATLLVPPNVKTATIAALEVAGPTDVQGWPDSAYRQWYLAEAAELSRAWRLTTTRPGCFDWRPNTPRLDRGRAPTFMLWRTTREVRRRCRQIFLPRGSLFLSA